MSEKGKIFNIQRFSTEDGPGIRTTIFLKGCAMNCLWCANPESKSAATQLAYRETLCKRCGKCITACSFGAISLVQNNTGKAALKINRDKCNICGGCVYACTAGAMHLYGRTVGSDEVLDIILKDKGYYTKSGGGVTASGGEALLQPDFVAEVFRQCQRMGIHTTLDTCGFFDPFAWDKVKEYVNLVLYDIKLMDEEKHKYYTGVDNDIILQNARTISESDVPMFIRIPLIPGVNDSKENLEQTADFVYRLDKTLHIDLLPYHNYGENKYKSLDERYTMSDVQKPSEEHMKWCQSIFTQRGLDCNIQ